jgi:hypothetical protein
MPASQCWVQQLKFVVQRSVGTRHEMHTFELLHRWPVQQTGAPPPSSEHGAPLASRHVLVPATVQRKSRPQAPLQHSKLALHAPLPATHARHTPSTWQTLPDPSHTVAPASQRITAASRLASASTPPSDTVGPVGASARGTSASVVPPSSSASSPRSNPRIALQAEAATMAGTTTSRRIATDLSRNGALSVWSRSSARSCGSRRGCRPNHPSAGISR